MDYSSERRDFSSSGGNYYGSGGNTSNYRNDRGGGYRRGGGRGGRGRGGYHPYRRDGRGGGGGGGGRRHGNRFNDQQQSHDPHQAALKTLQQMIHKLGELKATEEPTDQARALVVTQAKNIQALTSVICGPSKDIFLQFQPASDSGTVHLDKEAGPLASGIVNCAATAPLQAPVYATLTLAVHEKTKQEFPGFANRVINYATAMFTRDLDSILTGNKLKFDDTHRAVLRIKMVLRFFATLAKAGVLVTFSEEDDPVVSATNERAVSVYGLVECMAQAAHQCHDQHENNTAAVTLALLVYSTIPYLQAPADKIQEKLIEPLDKIVDEYKSKFVPGTGLYALLLKGEQIEDMGEEEEEEESDDDEDEDASEQVCDTLQDLRRTIKFMLDKPENQFELLNDAPWSLLKSETSEEDMHEGEAVVFTDEPLMLTVFPACESLSKLLGVDSASSLELNQLDLSGFIFGRLPIFGPPPEALDDEDEDEDMEEVGSERLQAYKAKFGMVDRYLVGDAVRDCILANETLVTDTGVEKGQVKVVAEQVLSLKEMVQEESGFEFSIIEAVFSLLVHGEDASRLRTLYLSRILLEMTRLDPSVVPAGIALAVTNLFNDYMPTLVPTARYALSQWFAFHLVGTDYQWPEALWQHWQPYVLFGWKNSRGAFVRMSMTIMAENVSDPCILIRQCFPAGSAFADHLLALDGQGDGDTADELEAELKRRVWESVEEPASLVGFVTGDDAKSIIESAKLSASLPWRSLSLIRALLKPASDEKSKLKEWLQNSKAGADPIPEDVLDSQDDPVSLFLDALTRYSAAVVAAAAKDKQERGSDDASAAEVFLISKLHEILSYSPALMTACLRFLVQHRILNVMNVLVWALGSSEKEMSVFRWWEYATVAIRVTLSAVRPLESSSMSDEDREAFVLSNIAPAIDLVEPFVSKAVGVVSEKAAGFDSEMKGSRYTPQQIDLLYGLKSFLSSLRVDLVAFAKDALDASENDCVKVVQKLHSSLLAPSFLVSKCAEIHGSRSIDDLKAMFEQI